MRIMIRVYRTHDYDLMALYMSGAINFQSAAKQALLAAYRGGGAVIEPDRAKTKVPDAMPTVMSFNIVIHESDAPGITKWLERFPVGYRNSCIKAILRNALTDPGLWLFAGVAAGQRMDMADDVPAKQPPKPKEEQGAPKKRTDRPPRTDTEAGYRKPGTSKASDVKTIAQEDAASSGYGNGWGEEEAAPGDRWVEAAEQQAERMHSGSVMVSDIDKLLEEPAPGSQGAAAYDTAADGSAADEAESEEDDGDDDFDALEVFESMRRKSA